MDANRRKRMELEEIEYQMRHGEAGTSSYNELEMICPSKYGRLMMTSINKKQTTIEDGFLGGADKRVFSCDMAVPKLQVLPNFSHQNKIKNPGRKRWVSKEDRNLRQTRSTSVPPLSLPLTEVSGDSGQHGHATALTMSSPPQSGILSPEQYIINQKIKRRKSLEQNRRSSDLGADVDIDNPGIFEVGQSIDVEKNEPVPEILSSQRVAPNELRKIRNHASKISQLIIPDGEPRRRYAHEDAPALSTPKSNEGRGRDALTRSSSWAPYARYNDSNASSVPTYKDTTKGVAVPTSIRGGRRDNMPKPAGGPRPVNRLQDLNHNTQAIGKVKAFDLHDPFGTSSTKRIIEPGLSGPSHREVLKVESDTSKQRVRDVSVSQSQRSNTHNGYSVGGSSRTINGHVEEMRSVERTMNIRPSRGPHHRKRKFSQQGSSSQESPVLVRRSQDVSKGPRRTVVRYNRLGDVDHPEDPIEDDDEREAVSLSLKSNPRSLRNLSSSNADETLPHKIKLKASEDELGNPSGLVAYRSVDEGGRSRHFHDQGTGSKRRKVVANHKEHPHKSGTERNDSISEDELAGLQLSVGKRKQREPARELLTQSSASAQPELDDRGYGSDSSADSNQAKPDIVPSTFTSSKPTAGSDSKHVLQYDVVVFYTESRYLWDQAANPCTLLYDQAAKLITISSHEEFEVTIPLNRISTIRYSQDRSQVFILTSHDMGPSKADAKYYIVFKDKDQSTGLINTMGATERIVLKFLEKDGEFMDNVFKKAADLLKTQPLQQEVRNIQRPKDKSIEKTDKLFNHALENKQAPTRKRLIDELELVEHQCVTKPRLRSSGEVEIAPNSFYGTGEQPSRTRNSSSRQSIGTSRHRQNSVPRRSPSPVPEERWTELNEGWEKSWKSSVVWPPVGKNKATVDIDDIARLDEGQFLNDNLVMFYLYHLQYKLQNEFPDIFKRVYFHNSFFYERLTSNSKGNKRGINYEAVERWTAKVDLLSYDYIIVPVNEHTHWYLAIICNAPKLLVTESNVTKSMEDLNIIDTTKSSSPPGKSHADTEASLLEVVPLDSDSKGKGHPKSPNQAVEHKLQASKPGRRKSGPKVDPSGPRIIALDSLNMTHSPTCTNLKHYLVAEVKSKLGIEIPVPTTIGLTVKNLPQQGNYCDCGLFLLGYVEKFLEDPDQFIRNAMTGEFPEDPTYWPDWKGMRTKVRSLLFDIQKQQVADTKNNKKMKKAKSSNMKLEKPPGPNGTTKPGDSSEGSSEPPISSAPGPEHANEPSSCTARHISPQDPAIPANDTSDGLPVFRDNEAHLGPDSDGEFLFHHSEHGYSDLPAHDIVDINAKEKLPPIKQNTALVEHERSLDADAVFNGTEAPTSVATKSSRAWNLFKAIGFGGQEQAEAQAKTVLSINQDNDDVTSSSPLRSTTSIDQPHQQRRTPRGISKDESHSSQHQGHTLPSSVAVVETSDVRKPHNTPTRKSTRNAPIEIDDDPEPISSPQPVHSIKAASENNNAEMLLQAGTPKYKGASRLTTDSPVSSPAHKTQRSPQHVAKSRSAMRSRGAMHRSPPRASTQNRYVVDASDIAVVKGRSRRQSVANPSTVLINLDE